MQANQEDQVKPLYTLTAECPACSQSFSTSRIRPRYKKAVKLDSDFCPYFADPDLNPDYYVVQVCEHCGCGTTERAQKRWSDHQRAEFNKRVASQWKFRSYGGQRSWQDALETYQLALLTAQTIRDSQRVIAGLLHHIVWLYRYEGHHELEQRYMRYALNAYQEVYERESDDNDARLIFIMAELHRRLGEYLEAAVYYARIIKDKRIADSAIIAAAREQWTIMRKEMKEQQMETPDELFQEESIKLSYKER